MRDRFFFQGWPSLRLCSLWVHMGRYDASGPQRNHMLRLLNLVVSLYIALSLYIIGLYGTWLLIPRCPFALNPPLSSPHCHQHCPLQSMPRCPFALNPPLPSLQSRSLIWVEMLLLVVKFGLVTAVMMHGQLSSSPRMSRCRGCWRPSWASHWTSWCITHFPCGSAPS